MLNANKTDIVAFLDSDAVAPARYARATVHVGATNSTDEYWQEYMVGPLPATNSTKVELLAYPFTSSPPGQTKVHPIYSAEDGGAFLTKMSATIEYITMKLWNGVSHADFFGI